MSVVGDVCMPGDKLDALNESASTGKIIIGPGLYRLQDSIHVSKPGILCFKEPNVYWIDSHQTRYVAVRGDNVLGIVTGKAGDMFRVDIGSSEQASLSYLAFEGATKRNRPDVKVGDIVYGRLSVADKNMEPELVCIDSNGRSSGMGVVQDEGFLLTTSCFLARKILSTDCVLLKTLGRSLPYEIAVGMNGRIWVKGRSTKETIALTNALQTAEYMNNDQIKVMVKRLMDALTGI